jgi:hypothetical protein
MSSPDKLKFRKYETELLSPLSGHALSDEESAVANLLLEATAAKPMAGKVIREELTRQFNMNLSSRTVMAIIRRLRKHHAFAILSSRQQPFGYWWCGSKQELQEFIERFKSVALDELHTLHRIVKTNYPELAGQLDFESIEDKEK